MSEFLELFGDEMAEMKHHAKVEFISSLVYLVANCCYLHRVTKKSRSS
jgi:hypothetical protein